jgi:hypothetical protein
MYLAWHLVHSPLEVPPLYFDPKCQDNKNRQLYHGMVTALDQGVGNVTRALRENGMLDNSLIIFYADNGGPLVTTGMSGNNYPLKGGKTDDFEGGTRAVSFIFGGIVPPALRGSTNHAYIHAADWYATLCGLAGVDPADSAVAGIPPIDSVDQWKTITTANATWEDGARQEMVLAYNFLSNNAAPSGFDAALIQGRYKIVTGHQGASGFWTGPVHPNSSGAIDPVRNSTGCGAFACCDGCLYDIQADPTEHNDLRVSMAALYEKMHGRLMELANTSYQTNYIQPGIECLTPQQAKTYYKGFRGPYCFNISNFPVVPTPPPTPPPNVPMFQLQSAAPHDRWCLSGSQNLDVTACASINRVGGGGGGDGGVYAWPASKAPAPSAQQWEVGDPKTGELAYAGNKDGLCIKLHEESGWNCANTPGTNATEAYLGHCSTGGGGAHKSNYFFLAPAGVNGGRTGTVVVKSHDCPTLCLARLDNADIQHGGSNRAREAPQIGLAACSGPDAVVGWQKIELPSTHAP